MDIYNDDAHVEAAHAMGRYSQLIGILSALKQGYAEKIEFHFENARRQLLGLETKINYNSSYYKDKVIVSKDDQGKPKAYITSEISKERVDISDQYDFSKNKTSQTYQFKKL